MESMLRKVDSFILDKMSEGKLPSIALAIVKDGKIIYSRGYGYKDVSKAEPSDVNTLYCIGSITKSFTGLSIMQLAEQGKLSINDPIDKYLTNVPDVFREGVTIHHLLTHSSGLPALGYAEAFIRGLVGIEDHWLPINNPGDVLTFMDTASEWRESEPGKNFFYLNEGYVALGLIIEKVSGLSYEKYVEENILKPLGMDHTYTDHSEIKGSKDLAKPYVVDESGKYAEMGFPYGIYADGGIVSNVNDLSRYIQMYINKGVLNGNRIVKEESIEKMEISYIKLPYEIFGDEGYGYGLMITPSFLGYKLVGHSGSILVHTGYMSYIRDKKLGIALLANGSGYPLSFIGQYILALLLAEDPGKLPYIRNDDILKKLEGEYQLYKGTVQCKVEKRGSILYLIMKEGAGTVETPLFPQVLDEDHAIFKTVSYWREYTIEFKFKDSRPEFIFERYKYRKI